MILTLKSHCRPCPERSSFSWMRCTVQTWMCLPWYAWVLYSNRSPRKACFSVWCPSTCPHVIEGDLATTIRDRNRNGARNGAEIPFADAHTAQLLPGDRRDRTWRIDDITERLSGLCATPRCRRTGTHRPGRGSSNIRALAQLGNAFVVSIRSAAAKFERRPDSNVG